MNRSVLLSLVLGAATGSALTVGSGVIAQVARTDVRETVTLGTVDGFCITVNKEQSDAGQGLTFSDYTGLDLAEVNLRIQSRIPDEDPAVCRVGSIKLRGTARTEMAKWARDYIIPLARNECKIGQRSDAGL